MSDPLDTEFEFLDLSISLSGKSFNGMLLSGLATLSGDEDGFYVTVIALDDGPTLQRRGNGWMGFPAAFEDEFFSRIAAVIENSKTVIGRQAEATWAEIVADMNSPSSRAIYAAEISGRL